MIKKRSFLQHLLWCFSFTVVSGVAMGRERAPQLAKVLVRAGQPGCQADIDAEAAGATDAAGKLTIENVDPSDHYVHVRCPGKAEAEFFISPQPNDTTLLDAVADTPPPAADPIVSAEQKARLPKLVQQAMQLRGEARLDEAVAALRQAMKLDPENSDLHRELGITLLQAKEWKRARVEMIEALHHDPSDADAHNGLGYALDKLGDIDGALKEYRTATNLQPDDATYRTHYLEALVKIQARKEGKK